MPIRTFSPMIDRTLTSMSSPIMMLWLDFRVRTSMGALAGTSLPPDHSATFRSQRQTPRNTLHVRKPAVM